MAAGAGISPDAEQTLAELCEDYWYPLCLCAATGARR